MIIKALKTFSDGTISLHEGEIANVPDVKATRFINEGLAVEYSEPVSEADLADYVKTEDLVTYSPDDLGAIGDGETIDDDAFLEGNYCYQLTEGKVYKVSTEKMEKIRFNSVVGGGVVRAMSRAGKTATELYLPTYIELTTRKPQSRFEECMEWKPTGSCWGTKELGTLWKKQSSNYARANAGAFHAIGAIYINEDKIADMPSQLTICFGRCVTWLRKSATKQWVKAVEDIKPAGLSNYKLPWSRTGSFARNFNHTEKMVDGHTELIVDKEELTSWLGDDPNAQMGCVHFWGHNYNFTAGEYDHLACAWEVWIKEGDYGDLLQIEPNIDAYNGTDSSTINQETVMPVMPISDEPKMFWACTMNVIECRGVDTSQFDVNLHQDFDFDALINKPMTYIDSTNRVSPNVLDMATFEGVAIGSKYTLTHDADDVFTVTKVSEGTWSDQVITTYVNSSMSDIKAGDTFRYNIEILEGYPVNNYIGNFYYASGDANTMMINQNTPAINNKSRVFSKVITANSDFSNYLRYGTNLSSLAVGESIKFRVWITKGDVFQPYSKSGANIGGYVFNNNFIDAYLEAKLSELTERVTTLENAQNT